MGQLSFLPVICDRTSPPPETSNDAEFIAVQDSTCDRYLCKSAKIHPLVPATEWICAELARSLKIPVADTAVIQIKGRKEKLFGSLWEDNGVEDSLLAMPKVRNKEIFTDAFAFDLSVHNADRHLGNFLYLKQSGSFDAKLIDASRAFLYHTPVLPPLPFEAHSATLVFRKYWSKFHAYDSQRASSMAQNILSLPNHWMTDALQNIPEEWLNSTEVAELDRWWRNDRGQRILDVIQEL